MGALSISKDIAMNAPKYTKIVEPFGDNGTFAEYLSKKKPKEHIVNFESEAKYFEALFYQNFSSSDKKALKAKDWVGSKETFDAVVKITATEGVDFYYRKTYLKHFSVRQKDPEAAPLFDWLKFNKNVKLKVLAKLPVLKGLFKKLTLLNEDSVSAMSQSGDFYILAPKTPEQIEAVESKIGSISANYFYLKKSKSNDDILEALDKFDKVSNVTGSTIMGATMQIATNYENRLNDLSVIRDESGV